MLAKLAAASDSGLEAHVSSHQHSQWLGTGLTPVPAPYPSQAQWALLICSSEMCYHRKLRRKHKRSEKGQPEAAPTKLEEHQDLSLLWE